MFILATELELITPFLCVVENSDNTNEFPLPILSNVSFGQQTVYDP